MATTKTPATRVGAAIAATAILLASTASAASADDGYGNLTLTFPDPTFTFTHEGSPVAADALVAGDLMNVSLEVSNYADVDIDTLGLDLGLGMGSYLASPGTVPLTALIAPGASLSDTPADAGLFDSTVGGAFTAYTVTQDDLDAGFFDIPFTYTVASDINGFYPPAVTDNFRALVSEAVSAIEVTPPEPAWVELCGTDNDYWDVPAAEGVIWDTLDNGDGTWSAVASADAGYVIADGAQTEWVAGDANVECVASADVVISTWISDGTDPVAPEDAVAGDEVEYAITVTNDGDYAFTGGLLGVSPAGVDTTFTIPTLWAGDTATPAELQTAGDALATYVLTQDDIDAGFVTMEFQIELNNGSESTGLELYTDTVLLGTPAVEVTPGEPQWVDECGAGNAFWAAADQDGIVWEWSTDADTGELIITAVALDGYVIADGAQSVWSAFESDETCTDDNGTGTDDNGTDDGDDTGTGSDDRDDDTSTPITESTFSPSEDDLTPALQDKITVCADGDRVVTLRRGDAITITVGECGAAVDATGWKVYAYSEPTFLGSNTATVVLPASLPDGTHHIAVYDANNELIGWQEIEVSGTKRMSDTGFANSGLAFVALGLIGAGVAATGGAYVLRRRSGIAA